VNRGLSHGRTSSGCEKLFTAATHQRRPSGAVVHIRSRISPPNAQRCSGLEELHFRKAKYAPNGARSTPGTGGADREETRRPCCPQVSWWIEIASLLVTVAMW
jgi:hypothetical protein